MSYKIRYGHSMPGRALGGSILRSQILGAGGLLMFTGMVRLLWADGSRWAAELLASGPVTAGEKAVAVFADALTEGEGWYRGLVVWCRTILNGGL